MSEFRTIHSKSTSRKKMSLSGISTGSNSLAKRLRRRPRSLQPSVPIVVYVTVNGKLDPKYRVVANNMDELLSNSTTALKLTSAARKVYSISGNLIGSFEQIKRYDEIFVSQGEPFIDPFKIFRESMEIQNNSFWGLNGLYVPKSKRQRNLSGNSMGLQRTWRVLSFLNGEYQLNTAFEIITNGKSIEEFKQLCESKFNFNGHCKRIFNMKGVEVDDLMSLTDSSFVWNPNEETVALGPVWCARNEELNLNGVIKYLECVKHSIKAHVKSSKAYLDQLEAMADGNSDRVKSSVIRSYSKREVNARKKEAEEKVNRYEDDLDKFDKRIKLLKERKNEIEGDANDLDYSLEKIKEKINSLNQKKDEEGRKFNELSTQLDDLCLKRKQNKNKIRNGDDDSSAQNDDVEKKKLLEVQKYKVEEKMFELESQLKELLEKQRILKTRRNKMAMSNSNESERRAFKSPDGLRLKVYLNGHSKGTAIATFFNLDKAQRGTKDASSVFHKLLDTLSENKKLTKGNDFSKGLLVRRLFTETGKELKDVLSLESDQFVCASFGEDWISGKFYCASATIYSVTKLFQINYHEFNKNTLPEYRLTENNSDDPIFQHLPLFQNKTKEFLFLTVSASVDEKKEKHSTVDYIQQNWLYTENGNILLKLMPSICLTLIEKVEAFTIENSTVQYCPVQLCPVEDSNPNQIWKFNTSGNIYSKASPSFLLTYLSWSKVSADSLKNLMTQSNLCAVERLPNNLEENQRWGFKQESFHTLGQWRNCDLPNPEWHKVAFTWPIKSDGSLNDKLNWPIDGLLVPCAPSVKERKTVNDSRFPKKLLIMRNNDHKMNLPIVVTGPDLTKLLKKSEIEKDSLHCSDQSLLSLEFKLFLDTCTTSLYLPSAARRLFDKKGQELFSLEGLNNDDIFYVSVGEMWNSPKNVLLKLQKRSYANKLASDIERLKYFLYFQTRNDDLTIGVRDNPPEPDAVLELQILNSMSRKEIEAMLHESSSESSEPAKQLSEDSTLPKTFHEKTCSAAALRWKMKPENKSEDTDTKEIFSEELPEKSKHSSQPWINPQQFSYNDGFIILSGNPKLAVYADDIGKPVVLKRMAQAEFNNQRFTWIFHKSGFIESEFFRGFVLTISSPRMLPFEDKCSAKLPGCLVILDKAIRCKFGNAHQRFHHVPKTSLFIPFSSNETDRYVTAAMFAGICSKFVCPEPISQYGNQVFFGNDNQTLCSACISVLGGKYPVKEISDSQTEFLCQFNGGFKVLGKSIDLSPSKAEKTYSTCVDKLQKIREELLIKPLSRKFDLASPNITVLLYRNGRGRTVPPCSLTAKTIPQIMEMGMKALDLSAPIRILFTENGSAIIDDQTFRSVLCSMNSKMKAAVASPAKIEEPKPSIPAQLNELEMEKKLNIQLSEDERYFTIDFDDNSATTFYLMKISVSSISNIKQFVNLHFEDNIQFLFNYEIFGHQINTDVFSDDNFEPEETDLTIKSSPNALSHLFSKVLPSFRLQLVAVKMLPDESGENEMRLDVESIDAFADFSFRNICRNLSLVSSERISDTICIPLTSAISFTTTSSLLTVEIALNTILSVADNENSDRLQLESSESDTATMVLNNYNLSEPIELWASLGESLSFPSNNSARRKATNNNAEIGKIQSELDQKRFLLRSLKGDRFKKQNPGTLESTASEKNPVKIKGNWQFPTLAEINLQKEIGKLENEMYQKKKPLPEHLSTNSSGNLYKQKHFKHCLVYLNGSLETSAVPIMGESISEIMENAAMLLGLKKKPKYLFRPNGDVIDSVNAIIPEELLALSHHPVFISSKDSIAKLEIKANWGRAKRKYGQKATEIEVKYRPNTIIDVDPFDPPDILKQAIELPAKEPKTISVFENGQDMSNVCHIYGYTLLELLNKAKAVLHFDLPVKCFYALDGRRISSFKEILFDDVLAASVSGKGLLKQDEE